MLRSLVPVLALVLLGEVAAAQSAPLRAGDRLVVVLADLVDTAAVRADGSAILPRIGSLSLSGLGLAAAEDSVRRAYATVSARTDVRVTAFRRVVVTGEVPRGDLLFVDATVGLAEALAMAGGVGPEGNRKRVELWRDGGLVGRFDVRSGAAVSAPLHSGDIVLVSRANWWSRNPFVIVSLLSSAVSLIIALSL